MGGVRTPPPHLTKSKTMTTTQRKIVSVPVEGGSKESVKITTPDDSANFARSLYDNDIDVVETFYVVLLDHALQTKHWALIGKGGVSQTTVDVRVICKHIWDSLASNVILVHNHPSGTLVPSDSDKKLTNAVKEVAKYLNCNVIDHIILTQSDYYSFSKNNLL